MKNKFSFAPNAKITAVVSIILVICLLVGVLINSIINDPFKNVVIDTSSLMSVNGNSLTVIPNDVSDSDTKNDDNSSEQKTDIVSSSDSNSGKKLLYPTDYPYFIEVDITNQITTIYTTSSSGKYDKVVRYMLCSTAQEQDKFGEGYWKLKQYRSVSKWFPRIWHPMKSRGHQLYAQYITQISGDFLFHSVPYPEAKNNTLDIARYNKLGTADSGGCIRLTTENAKWINENCKAGTTVHLVKKEKNPQLAEAVKQATPKADKSGWDPTDPNKNNPNYHTQYPDPDPKPEGYEVDNRGLNKIKYSAEKARIVYN